MASGFIILKDGRCFAPRWTGYDEIIRIAIYESREIERGVALADWLEMQIPLPENNDDNEMGWGFIDPRTNQIINRELDLRSLTLDNQKIFWIAIKNGRLKINNGDNKYSTLSSSFINAFYTMFELAEKGAPPMENSDWNKLADPCSERNGPGWDNLT